MFEASLWQYFFFKTLFWAPVFGILLSMPTRIPWD